MRNDNQPPRLAVVTPRNDGEFGGAERLFESLAKALNSGNVVADHIQVKSDEKDFDSSLRSYLRFFDKDLSMYDGVISTKAPSFAIRHRRHVVYLLHTHRIYYDMFDQHFPAAGPRERAQRDVIRRMDTAALSRPSVRRIFAVGEEVRQRLLRYNGLDADVLHHPTALKGLRAGAFRYFFVPGRCHPWKRIELVLQAAARMRNGLQLIVSGQGIDLSRLQNLAKNMTNIRFVGHVSDATLATLYANALAVIFCPVREDYGLVTVEAFCAGKPVVTCRDSGEPARLVRDGASGYVCPPEADALAECLDRLAENASAAKTMGEEGRQQIQAITWQAVCAKLVDAFGFDRGQTK